MVNCGLPNIWVNFNEDLDCSGWSGAPVLDIWNTFHWRGQRWALCTRMVLFNQSGSSRSCHPWRTYRWKPSSSIFRLEKIQFHHNSKLLLGKVGRFEGLVALPVGCLGCSISQVGLDGLLKIHRNMSRLHHALNWVVTSVLGNKWCLECLFVFQVPVYYIYLVEHYPI